MFFITILILSTIIVSGSISNMVAFGIIGGSGTSNQRNQACYNAGFGDGRTHPFNQTTYNGCSTYGRAYYEGFLSGCIAGQGKDYFSCQRITNLTVLPEEYDSGYDNYHPGCVDIIGVCSSTGISSASRLMSRYPDHLPVGSWSV